MRRRELVLIVNHAAGSGFAVKTGPVPGRDAGLTDASFSRHRQCHLGYRHGTAGHYDPRNAAKRMANISAGSTIPAESPVTARSVPRDFLFHRAASIAKSRSGEKYLVKKPAPFSLGFRRGRAGFASRLPKQVIVLIYRQHKRSA